MKVASDFLRPALSSVYEVAGRFLLLEVSDADSAAAIHSFLSRWHITQLLHSSSQIDAKITVLSGNPPATNAGFEKFPLMDGAMGYATDTAYRIDFGGAVMAADESNVVKVWLDHPLRADSAVLPQLVSHALSAGLRRCAVFELHSGAVTDELTGNSVLICGPSGSGKSTLTLQLAAAGWNYLSDDVVLLSFNGSGVEAFGLRRFFAITRETVDMIALPQVRTLFAKGEEDFRKFPLVPEEIFPDGWVGVCRPNRILFVSVAEKERSEVHQLSAAETMSRLIRLCPWSCYDRAVARNFLDVLAKLVKQCLSFDLASGTELLGEPGRTAEFLTTALQERSL